MESLNQEFAENCGRMQASCLARQKILRDGTVDYMALSDQADALLFEQEDYARAAPLFGQAADAAKAAGNAANAAVCYNRQALCLDLLWQHEPAVAASDKAIEADRTDWRTWNTRGVVLSAILLGRHADAAESFQEALDRIAAANPPSVSLHLACARSARGRARALYARALSSSCTQQLHGLWQHGLAWASWADHAGGPGAGLHLRGHQRGGSGAAWSSAAARSSETERVLM